MSLRHAQVKIRAWTCYQKHSLYWPIESYCYHHHEMVQPYQTTLKWSAQYWQNHYFFSLAKKKFCWNCKRYLKYALPDPACSFWSRIRVLGLSKSFFFVHELLQAIRLHSVVQREPFRLHIQMQCTKPRSASYCTGYDDVPSRPLSLIAMVVGLLMAIL